MGSGACSTGDSCQVVAITALVTGAHVADDCRVGSLASREGAHHTGTTSDGIAIVASGAISIDICYFPTIFSIFYASNTDQIVPFCQGGIVVVETLGGSVLVAAADRTRYVR